ncbi:MULTISPECIES: toprim domain-containing protein [unclassified Methylobacterium]|uniref:DUF7146 domain-containing protein n=1 Tax=unclassified Methylobacterium TaxID=2615210 RepID=UPI00165067F4|nr:MULTISPECIES: toprim domain-containing protein [unclassified Methylobacterium]
MTSRLRILKAALGGDISGRTLNAPTIGHGPSDRGTSYTDSPGAPDGLLVTVRNGGGRTDDLAAKDRALQILGELPEHLRRRDERPDPAAGQRRLEARRQAETQERADSARRQRQALAIWEAASDPRATVVEAYLASRGLGLPADIAGDALRFSKRCPWGKGETAMAMVAPFRCVRTGAVVGIHRTALSPAGAKLGRKMLGAALGAAIMLDPPEDVATGLTIGEGIESCLAARQLGIRPVWALGSTAGIASFPVLDGIECLTVLGERDAGASDAACNQVGTRWHETGRLVDVVMPRVGKDMNDVLRAEVAA